MQQQFSQMPFSFLWNKPFFDEFRSVLKNPGVFHFELCLYFGGKFIVFWLKTWAVPLKVTKPGRVIRENKI